MNEEISRILRMVEEGKINSEEAMQLIDALNGESKEFIILDKVAANNSHTKGRTHAKMLKIRIKSKGNDNANINIPLKFVSGMIKTFGRIPNVNVDGMENVDMDAMTQSILDAIDNGMDGKIVDIKSGDGDAVEIVIE
ncbi:hypothetical protein K2F40_05265 [Clostridium sp. CM028]|uniref:SHOCT-like domain-containing protein n=1 Tax=Clostridium TaxID=1485 RepID=UPI0013EEDDB5|nr:MULTISPECIES: hypothetical protein [Clostridium]MBU3091409.1 hypothetical protein [Clostridium sp. CF011]MBW9145142.1 hypothetical protein [Clostridium sp. CM027]MBW9148382.1 hypothetical protein [Clostridium sp. CM028]MBZ9609474.1 hypothetical protein [Clostridium estertheticum]UVE40278.1 hypothetical protein KTC92_14265 [Clostridium sp. CM027]